MILDLAGGMLSLFQLALEAVVLKDASLITGDPVKLCLGLLSVLYDCLIIFQHFILYPESKRGLPETRHQDADALLGDGPPRVAAK
jgi:cystinosin